MITPFQFKIFSGFFLLLVAIYLGTQYYLTHFHYIPETLTTIENEYFSEEEFKVAASKYQMLVNEQNPSVALIALREDSRQDNKLANACHAIAHMIGHASYERFESFAEALSFSEVACNNGYIHGIAQSHFKTLTDIEGEVVSTCADYDVMTSIGSECRHGVGHGLTLAYENDIYAAIEKCDLFPNTYERHACYTGAFMENFHTNELYHPSLFLDTEDPFLVCRSIESKYQPACDRYAIHYYIRAHDNNFAAGLKRCESVRSEGQAACALGVGDLAIKEHFNEPKVVESLCDAAATREMHDSCIEGLSGLYVNQFGSISEGLAMCETLEPTNRTLCLQLIHNLPEGYYEREQRDESIELKPVHQSTSSHLEMMME